VIDDHDLVSGVSVTDSDETASSRSFRADGIAVGFLIVAVSLAVAYLWRYDMWMSRTDILTFYLPWYSHLGQQLRDFSIPGWNPHLFSGTPFAADPQSGWTQLPVMVTFMLLKPVTAMKALIAFNLFFAALTTYAYARLLTMNVVGSVAAAVAFALSSSFIGFNSYCCNLMGSYATWIPLTLIGIELSVRRKRLVERVGALGLAGLGMSQMLAGWLGQGTFYAVLLVASYAFYRIVISPPDRQWNWRDRTINLAVTGAVLALAGFGLAAAGLLPRLDVSRVTNLAGGRYDLIAGATGQGYLLRFFFRKVLDPAQNARRIYLGTGILVLAMIAPLLARRRFAVPYFFFFTLACFALMLRTNVVHHVLYLMPRFEELHSHSSYRIFGLLLIGPAMLVGASVDRLMRMKLHPAWLLVVLYPLFVFYLIREDLASRRRYLPHDVWLALLLMTMLVGGIIALRLIVHYLPASRARLKKVVSIGVAVIPCLMILLLMYDPIGHDFSNKFRNTDTSKQFGLIEDQDVNRLNDRIEAMTRCDDPGGDYLQQQLDAQSPEPFRYFGFDPLDIRNAENLEGGTYQGHAGTILEQGLLVANQAICFGLYDVQGYNPMQIQRYVDFVEAINGVALNYHDAIILASGIGSPLIDLLNARYVITPYDIPAERDDLEYVQSNMTQVFEDGVIRIFENPDAYDHAWMVHEAQQLSKDEVLPALQSGQIDPKQTVLIEQSPPSMVASTGAPESVAFTSYTPDQMSMRVTANSDGMLVLSEVYAPGWNAYVDGTKVDLYAADYVLRGIPVPAGEHTVSVRYELRSLQIGTLISTTLAIAFLVIGGYLAWDWRQRRRLASLPSSIGPQSESRVESTTESTSGPIETVPEESDIPRGDGRAAPTSD
jgi:hypothetical protein